MRDSQRIKCFVNFFIIKLYKFFGGDVGMKVIKLMLQDTEIARVVDGKFKNTMTPVGICPPDFYTWYNDCFYSIKNARTFEERFEAVKEQRYFCYSKPTLKLIAEEVSNE